VAAILWGPDLHFLAMGVQNAAMAFNPNVVAYNFCRQLLNSACTLISVAGRTLNINVENVDFI